MSHFSVVIPAFNAQSCVDRALQSLAEQHQPVDEVIVVDDGSADGTVDTVLAWEGRLPIVLLRNDTNRGIGVSLRRGVDAARSDWVLRLDADDRWLPGHVQALSDAARQPGVSLVTAPAVLVDEAGRRLGMSQVVHDADVRALLMWDNPLVQSASGFSREAYRAVGGYRVGVRWEDYDLWIRLLSVGRLGSSSSPSVEYTVSSTSLSRVKRSVAIAARWYCQRQAVERFWRRHPLAASRALTLGAGRVLFSPLF